MEEKIKEDSIAIVTHVYATGPAFFLEDYLIKKKIKKLLFIGLPFSYAKESAPFFRYYENGKLIEEKKLFDVSLPDLLLYIRDVLVTLYIFSKKGKFDYFIGVDNLNACSGLVLQFLHRVRNVIFYTIDYVPNRFTHKMLNSFYHFLEKTAVYKSNVVWNLSPIMMEERMKNGYDKKYNRKQITVPIGTIVTKKLKEFKNGKEKIIVFMGHLRKGQGVQFLLESSQMIFSKIRDAKLIIIGGGELEKPMRSLARKLGITKKIVFTGFVKDFKEVQNILSKAAIAVAPYEDTKESFTRYTDPGKVKEYLALGLPVVMTKVPQVAYEVDARKAGIAVDFDQKKLVDAICKILLDNKTLNIYRRNAYTMAKDYEWDTVFKKALKQTYKLC